MDKYAILAVAPLVAAFQQSLYVVQHDAYKQAIDLLERGKLPILANLLSRPALGVARLGAVRGGLFTLGCVANPSDSFRHPILQANQRMQCSY